MVFYRQKRKIPESSLEKELRNKRILLFGASKNNEEFWTLPYKDDVIGIFDNDPAKWGTQILGIPVMRPVEGIEDVVIVSAVWDWKSISEQVKSLGYEEPYYFISSGFEDDVDKYLSEFKDYNNQIRESKTYKYVHFIPDEKFFMPVLEYINYGMDIREHFFCIYRMNGANHGDIYGVWDTYKQLNERYENIYLVHDHMPLCFNNFPDQAERLEYLMKFAKKIIFHGEWMTKNIKEYLREHIRYVKEKGCLVVWSGNAGITDQNKEIFEVLQHARWVRCSENEKLKERYPGFVNAVFIPENVSYARITPRLIHTQHRKNVLICNRGHSIANGMESLELVHEKKWDIEVWAITSYGDQEYIDALTKRGELYYGEHFHAVGGYMDYLAYVKFLNEMDVAVLAQEVKCGRDTFELLNYLGVKTYVNLSGNMKFFRDVAGYKLPDMHQLKYETEEEIFENPNMKHNQLVAEKREFDVKKKMLQWKTLYEYEV